MSWPIEASREALQIDRLAGLLLAVSVGVLALVSGLIVIFLIRYRRGSKAYRGPLPISENKVEAGWIAGTTLGFLVFFFLGARLFVRLESGAPGGQEIQVVARQWMWDIRQPNGRREFDTLHLPLGVRARLRLTSEDVIHSFYVPAFRMKQDVVPGKEALLSFTPTRAGSYPLFCSEFCGTKHAQMVGTIIVEEPSAYAAWLAETAAPGGSLAEGRRQFLRYGCSGCHESDAVVHAPWLQGLFGTRVPMADGGFALVDNEYLRDCILQPEKIHPAGYALVMPSFKGVITETDLNEILAYLRASAAP